MMRILYTFAFVLLTTFAYAQKSTLLQNINVRAKELKHSLNKTEDSLILEGERTIYKVAIFNNDFEQSLIVKNSKVIIPLNNIPVGRFVVEAALPDKLIVITLLRNEAIGAPINAGRLNRKTSLLSKTSSTKLTTTTSEKKTTGPKIAVVAKKAKVIADTKESTNNEELTTAKNLLENSAHKNVVTYWIVYKTNNSHSSGKEMRFGDEALVNKMISHINLDKRTIMGRQNELTIWEIYDVSKFLKYKMKNPNDFSLKSDSFNAVPYFKIEKHTTNP